MNNENIVFIIYCIIGFTYATYHWDKYYENDYRKSKEMNKVEDDMANILMIFVWLLWPLFAVKELFIKIKNYITFKSN